MGVMLRPFLIWNPGGFSIPLPPQETTPMWRTGVVALFALLCVSESALAQATRISGTVRAADGSGPIAAAEVTIAGTKRGAITRDDGRFNIDVGAGTYRVVAKRIGYAPDSQTVIVRTGGTTTADVNLKITAGQVGGIGL